MTAVKPGLALAMFPGLETQVLDQERMERLAQSVEILDSAPLAVFTGERAARVLADTEILFGHWGCPRLDAVALTLAPRLRMLAYAAGSVKDVVTPEVWERGLRVTSAAFANARPVAEFTLAVILLANKDAFSARERLRVPSASIPFPTRPLGNPGKTIGIVGASHVGRHLIGLLRPFGFHVLVLDPYMDAAEAAGLEVEKIEDLGTLLSRSDVVSIHAPENETTRGMLGAEELALMRDGATLVNTARGALVDTAALTAEVESGRLNAVLDVTDPEPLPTTSPLLALPNAFVTPHIAGALGTELGRLSDLAIEEIERHVAGLPPLYPVREGDLGRIA